MSFYDLQQLLVSAASILMPVAGAVYTWFATQKAAARKEIEAILKRLEAAELQLAAAGNNANALAAIDQALIAHDKRVSTLEQAFQHMPDKDSMHRLEMTVEGLKGQLSVVAKSLEGVDRIAQRIDTYLLENKAS